MSYKYVLFVRQNGRNQNRGEIAGLPLDKFPAYSEPFIVCKVDASVLTEDLLTNDKVSLKLSQLQKPNTTKAVTDDEGNTNTVTVYDYYDIDGRSSEAECPVITLNDVDLHKEVANG